MDIFFQKSTTVSTKKNTQMSFALDAQLENPDQNTIFLAVLTGLGQGLCLNTVDSTGICSWLFLAGVWLVFMVAQHVVIHECVHYNVFLHHRLNRLLGKIMCVPLGVPAFQLYQKIHVHNHLGETYHIDYKLWINKHLFFILFSNYIMFWSFGFKTMLSVYLWTILFYAIFNPLHGDHEGLTFMTPELLLSHYRNPKVSIFKLPMYHTLVSSQET